MRSPPPGQICDLTVTGHGDTDPVAPNSKGGEDNPEGRAENRRVEIRYDGSSSPHPAGG